MATGYSLLQLLESAPETVLDEMTGGALTLVGEMGDLPTGAELAGLVLKTIDPSEALSSSASRRTLLSLLPQHKLDELLNQLGFRDFTLDSALDELDSRVSQDRSRALLRFFGYEPAGAKVGAPTSVGDLSPAYSLFRHQRLTARSVVKSLTSPPRRVLLHMPTGSGKTRTAMHIVCRHLREVEPTIVLWLAYNEELLQQAAEEFERAWQALGNRDLQIGRYWGSTTDVFADQTDGLLVAGLTKLHRASKRVQDAFFRLADRTTLTVMDEAHQAPAETYLSIIETFASKHPKAALLGLSATPGRTWADPEEDRRVSEIFAGNKVMLDVGDFKGSPIRFLIEEEFLARPKFRQLRIAGSVPQEAEEDLTEYSDSVLRQLGKDNQRNRLLLHEIQDLTTRHQRILVFASSVGQARLLSATLTALGVGSDYVTGESAQVERRRVIERFRSNLPRPIVLVNYGVLTAGFDAPRTSAVLIGRPTKSLVLYSQMVGRATRGPRAGGNRECEIVTVVNTELPGFGDLVEAFTNWEDVWDD